MNGIQSSPWVNRLNNWFFRHRIEIYAFILIIALVSVEGFNYSTTQVALKDLLGSISFIGIPWYAILALAFCSIDFAGVARLFVPDDPSGSTENLWYLFGAWLLAATVNAMLTWWGVSLALVNHKPSSTSIIDASVVFDLVPVVVAIMVWVTRILLIASFSRNGLSAGVSASARPISTSIRFPQTNSRPQPSYTAPAFSAQASRTAAGTNRPLGSRGQQPMPASKVPAISEPEYIPEPGYAATRTTYHTLTATAAHRTATNIRS